MRGRRASRLLPPEIEEYRDAYWCRENTARIETAAQAEQFIERVGFAACLTDGRQPGPSLYVAVCGRRDATMPRNVQKDPETSHTWMLKDELMRRGRLYYGKLARGKAMFLAPRTIPYFKTLWGVRRHEEKKRLSKSALRVLRVLRKEWEMGTADLRLESCLFDRKRFTQALNELQTAMIVVPNEAVYQPKFSYLRVGRRAFPGRVGDESRSSHGSTRNRTMLSRGGRYDGSGRTGACHCVEAS